MDQPEPESSAVVVANVYGDFCMRKARRKRQKMLVQEVLYDYANNTTLHGIPYTTKKGLSLTEKIFWLLTFITSICLCSYLINNVWVKWKTSPVIVTISEELVSVGKVPFPSLTICPQLKAKASIYNFTEQYLKFNKIYTSRDKKAFKENIEQFCTFNDVANVCMSTSIWTIDEYYLMLYRNYTNANLADIITKVAPVKKDVFVGCHWRDGFYDANCEETLTTVLTSEGLCFNVNSLSANEILRQENIQDSYPYMTANKSANNWTMEEGYSHLGPDVYPVAGKENGAFPDLQITMRDNLTEYDNICNVLNGGFRVFVQHPAELPQSSLYYYPVVNSQVSSVALSFLILNTAEALRDYSVEIRQCYFPEERFLKYFKIYTSSNCRLECLTNYTFDHCGCVGFFMPHNNTDRICTTERKPCMEEARGILERKVFNKEDKGCICLPPCNNIEYEAEMVKTEFHLNELMTAASLIYPIQNITNVKYSKLEVYFKKPRFTSMRRSELFGLTDFLANIGGLLGLFLGFSFLSLIELFYFVTLRICCTLKKDLKEEKKQRRNTIAFPKKY